MSLLPSDEDAKLLTLARLACTRALGEPASGAAVRDSDGRTYAGALLHTGGVRLSALSLALGAATSSGARTFEAALIVGDEPGRDDQALLDALGVPYLVLARSDGAILDIRHRP
jgi:hypothetical protein